MNRHFYNDLELIKKDKKQFEAFRSNSNSVIIAGPGSGKTRVLTLKAVSLCKTQISPPAGLACISYSRETVRELRKRLTLYGYTKRSQDFIGTVHTFSLIHVLSPFGHLYKEYNIKYPIKILPDEIKTNIYNSILNDLGTNSKEIRITDIDRHRSLAVRGRSKIEIESTNAIAAAADLFDAKLHATEYIDFIEIITLSAKIIREKEYVRHSLQCKFPWLLVDEYQDLGKALHEMVLELVFNASIKLYAVGDINQSIYGFNGGYPEFLTELTSNDDINTITLEANYRSSQHIIDASMEALNPRPPAPNYIAQNIKDAAPDFAFITCKEEIEEQFEVIATKIIPKLISRNTPLNEIGIIVGSNYNVRRMGQLLAKASIPFFIAKWDFENSEVVVWLQDCARWCISPADQSFDELVKNWNSFIAYHDDLRKNWTNSQRRVQLFQVLTKSKGIEDINTWLIKVITDLDLLKLFSESERYPDEPSNLVTLLETASIHSLKGLPLDRFAKLRTPANEVTITTRHSSKGLEFEVVILPGMEEGSFPSFHQSNNPAALEEAQRLCYVCISRAKKTCILLMSKIITISTFKGPWKKEHSPSRYWNSLAKKFANKENTFTSETYH